MKYPKDYWNNHAQCLKCKSAIVLIHKGEIRICPICGDRIVLFTNKERNSAGVRQLSGAEETGNAEPTRGRNAPSQHKTFCKTLQYL